MNRTAFFEAAGQLSNWVSNLQGTTESSLRQIEDILCRPLYLPFPPVAGEEGSLYSPSPPGGEGRVRGSSPDALSDVAVLFLCLGAIRDRIEEVMNAFDALCE